jgi:uncharacterized protein (TIRG00374 family)
VRIDQDRGDGKEHKRGRKKRLRSVWSASIRHRARHSIRLALGFGGLACVAWLVSSTGVEALLRPLRALSVPSVALLFLIDAAVILVTTLAWRRAFDRPVPLRRLLPVRVAGEAINVTSASVVGEPVKAYLLQPAVPIVEGMTAQLIDKTSITAAQVLFLAFGLITAALWVDVPRGILHGMCVLLVLQIVMVAGFIGVQRAGIVRGGLGIARRLGLRTSGTRLERLAPVDASIARAYGERRGRLLECIGLHLLGWVAASLEVYVVLQWLGPGRPWGDALVIDSFGTGVKFMGFAIPAGLGALEGGYMLAFSAVGHAAALGLSFTLVRRARVIVWSVIGFVILLAARRTVAARARSPRAASGA